jgi:quinol-cytochrome oxidoreductase complex cytochrome b subunit
VDQPGERGERGDPLARAGRVLLIVLGVQVAVLVVTGVALYFLYRPSSAQAWNDLALAGDDGPWEVRLSNGLRFVHRLTSALAVLTAVGTGVVVALAGRVRLRRWRGAAIGSGIALTTLAASVTGFLLPWDQLGLWAVTVGTNLRGYGVLFESSVRFVLIGGVEIQPATLLRWLGVHTLVLGPALVVLVAFASRRVSPRTTPETPARSPAR